MNRNQHHCFQSLLQTTLLAVMFCLCGAPSFAQTEVNRAPQNSSTSDDTMNQSIRELRDQVRDLQASIAAMRSDWQQSRAETAELRRELDQLRARNGSPMPTLTNAVITALAPQATADQSQNPDNQTPQKKSESASRLDEEYQLLAGKVDDQYQTKVESASKYRLRLSGIVLMNLVSNHGVTDSIDLPMLAYPRAPGNTGGSFGATVRQSEFGLEAFGPTVAGARTKADLQIDLAGGFPTVPNGINSGLMRLRTATMRMDWTNTSVVVGQDAIFFSPNTPTSFASLAIPALSSAGNLWSWVPQIRVEHRIAINDNSAFLIQGGILDPVSGEIPGTTTASNGSFYYRQPGPGEASRQPAYATRIAWTHTLFGQTLRLGAGVFYSRQDYGFSRHVDGWAGMSDIEIPFTSRLTLTGSVYRGRALGGLYGGIGRSVLFSGDPTLPTTQVEALNSVGGWAQLKFRATKKFEINTAFGMDNPYARNLEYFPYSLAYGDASLARNLGSFANMIYRPRSDLLFSAEYRHLTTYSLNTGGSNAGQLNLAMGVLF